MPSFLGTNGVVSIPNRERDLLRPPVDTKRSFGHE